MASKDVLAAVATLAEHPNWAEEREIIERRIEQIRIDKQFNDAMFKDFAQRLKGPTA